MNRKLIVGYDPDHGGADVLRLGRLLAAVLAARPVVVTALPWPSHLATHEDLQRMAHAEMRARFAAIEDDLGDLDPETHAVPCSSPALALHSTAEAEDAMLIVLGSSHRGPVGRTLAGSVGESLIGGAPCAIAVAPRGYADRTEHRLLRIAVGFDGSPEAWTALETAIGLTERCHGYLTVCAVADCPTYGFAAAWSVMTAGEIEDAERSDKLRLLELACARAPKSLSCEGRILTGSPGSELAGASDDFDLMITGSRSYGPIRRTILGSTSRKLIRASVSPVLVLPRGAGLDPLAVRPRLRRRAPSR